jgi:hypothetical protein
MYNQPFNIYEKETTDLKKLILEFCASRLPPQLLYWQRFRFVRDVADLTSPVSNSSRQVVRQRLTVCNNYSLTFCTASNHQTAVSKAHVCIWTVIDAISLWTIPAFAWRDWEKPRSIQQCISQQIFDPGTSVTALTNFRGKDVELWTQ